MSVIAWPISLGVIGPSRYHQGLAWLTVGCCVAAWVPSGLRWLRVAQREHYLAGSVSRFAGRWWRLTPTNLILAVVALAAAGASLVWPITGVGVAAVVASGPVGLSLRGRTSPLRWTRRLRVLAVAWVTLEVVVVVIGVAIGLAAPLAVLAAVVVPVAVDLACAVTSPLERRLSEHFVREATERLRRVDPTVVAVTGSYGKTSTKGHIAHLLRPALTVVATPASFNNRAGLARAVNEHLADGTEVFVAEMGTYERGEIAELCQWCPPTIAVITAIGPVHLERFGSEDEILAAKSEIAERAITVVLNTDDDRLARLGDDLARRADPPLVVRCSGVDRTADVCVIYDSGVCEVLLSGSSIAAGVELPEGAQPTNVACAIGVAHQLGVSPVDLVARLGDLPTVPHRLAVATAPSGVVVIDDTFNSNPAGARAALAILASATKEGRRVVVTPGMVELGRRQAEENRIFGRAALEVATSLVVVGRTNRSALVGAARQQRPITVRTREDAVRWV
ncbi:MAG TPA: UDP-N-acetylmuramoyl-tripeptide--D-alanyl-D-alanine ligase, partial [Acidimicrobiales bacterium]|nr:UDP-N-acetylmuramoyl-tripeptide--D-alanyl-D-alanine ligase [Acidimicrobiales bacterium]